MHVSIQNDIQQLTLLKNKSHKSVDMSSVVSIIMGGGQGTRLFPLTQNSCKPSMLFGGRYRLIDIPVSNSLNAGITKIFVLTQFLSRSLHRHIFKSYRQDHLFPGFIEVLAAEQRPGKTSWFQGTADAVRQNTEYLSETPGDFFLILSGDQLYHIDFEKMVQQMQENDIDVLVATLAVNAQDASRMGIMKINEDQHIIDFCEKPTKPLVLDKMRTAPKVLEKMGLNSTDGKEFLGSMGIYLFKREALFDLLDGDQGDDFGKHLIPSQVQQGKIGAFIHDGYWEDIGTIKSYYEANLSLNENSPPFTCYTETAPIYTAHSHLPGPKISNTHIRSSTICEGCVIDAEEITNSILGQGTVVGKKSIIRDSYILGSETHDYPQRKNAQKPAIGENCCIKKAILDKNVSLGNNVQIVNREGHTQYDAHPIYVRDGITIISKNARLPDNFIF